MCSASESSERFLFKQVEDKENTFAVRKVKLESLTGREIWQFVKSLKRYVILVSVVQMLDSAIQWILVTQMTIHRISIMKKTVLSTE